jgi:tetratricopeptide (TPR) repeat protein
MLAAQAPPAKSPRVLVIGKHGISTNVEAYYLEATNEVKEAAAGVLPTTPEIISEPDETPSVTAAAAMSVPALVTTPQSVPAPAQPPIDWDPLVSAMEMMIEQQKMSMLAMEKSRSESTLAAREASLAMQEQMKSMEQALAAQRQHEAESMTRMNRLVIGVAAGFAGTGVVVMIFTAWFFMRTMSKISEINSNLHTQLLALPQIQQAQLGNGSGVAANPASQRLIGALEQLEHRIRDLEHTSDDEPPERSPVESVDAEIIPPTRPSARVEKRDTSAKEAPPSPAPESVDEGPSVAELLSKGQTLMNLDQPGDALGCFDRALKKQPRNAEALLKKGTALERLRRMQEAIDAYDGAIAIDDSMTMAYLAKGGLCNRMERYSEALECYEKALQSQQQAA